MKFHSKYILACLITIFMFAQLASLSAFANEAKLLELSKKMHEIRPVKQQIEEAMSAVALRLPEDERTVFESEIQKAMDEGIFEDLSVDTMSRVFTERELSTMVEFYGKPEMANIERKFQEYQQQMQPEIFKIIDAAMMKARTGTTE